MKNLMITSVLALGMITTSMAQETASIDTKEKVSVTQNNQDFATVQLKDVPKPILKAVETDFGNAVLSKAWKNAKGEYKLELMTEDKKAVSVMANSKGEWIKE